LFTREQPFNTLSSSLSAGQQDTKKWIVIAFERKDRFIYDVQWPCRADIRPRSSRPR